jgi:Protein of unknown function (DUF2442)
LLSLRIERIFIKDFLKMTNLSLTINKSTNAAEVWFDTLKMFVRLDDGREVAIPLDWFPRLRDATEKQKNWRLIGGGEGIHWEDIDEDILVEGLLH